MDTCYLLYIFSELEQISRQSPENINTNEAAQRASAIFGIKTSEMTDLLKQASQIHLTESEIEEWSITIYETIKSLGTLIFTTKICVHLPTVYTS